MYQGSQCLASFSRKDSWAIPGSHTSQVPVSCYDQIHSSIYTEPGVSNILRGLKQVKAYNKHVDASTNGEIRERTCATYH